MADLVLRRGRNRGFLIALTPKAKDWMRDTFEAKDIGPASVVSFNIDVMEDYIESLKTEELEVEW